MQRDDAGSSNIVDLARYGLKGECRCVSGGKGADPRQEYSSKCCLPGCSKTLTRAQIDSSQLELSRGPLRRRSHLDWRPAIKNNTRMVSVRNEIDKQNPLLGLSPQPNSSPTPQRLKFLELSRGVTKSQNHSKDLTAQSGYLSASSRHNLHRSTEFRPSIEEMRQRSKERLDSKSMESLRNLFIESRLKSKAKVRPHFDTNPNNWSADKSWMSQSRNFQTSDRSLRVELSPPQVATNSIQKSVQVLVEPIVVDIVPVSATPSPRPKFIDPAIGKQFSFCADQLGSPSKTSLTFQERPSEASIDMSVSIERDAIQVGGAETTNVMHSSTVHPVFGGRQPADQNKDIFRKDSFDVDFGYNNRGSHAQRSEGKPKHPLVPILALTEESLGTPSFNRLLGRQLDNNVNTPKFSERMRELCEDAQTEKIDIRGSVESYVRLSSDRNEENELQRGSSNSYDFKVVEVEVKSSPPNTGDKSSQEANSTTLSMSKELHRPDSRSSLVTDDEEKEAEEIKHRIKLLEQECQNFFKKRDLTATIITATDSKDTPPEIITSPRNRVESSCYSLRSASPSVSKFEVTKDNTQTQVRMGSQYPGLAQFLKISRIQSEALLRLTEEDSKKPDVSALLTKYLGSDNQRDKYTRSFSLNIAQDKGFLSKAQANPDSINAPVLIRPTAKAKSNLTNFQLYGHKHSNSEDLKPLLDRLQSDPPKSSSQGDFQSLLRRRALNIPSVQVPHQLTIPRRRNAGDSAPLVTAPSRTSVSLHPDTQVSQPVRDFTSLYQRQILSQKRISDPSTKLARGGTQTMLRSQADLAVKR